MSLCINPHCQNPDNPDSLQYCQSCCSELLLDGRYRVTRLLSDKGGFGKIFEISDPRATPKVLKVLIKNDAKAIELFKQEAKILRRLDHPGIPKAEDEFSFSPKNSQEPLLCIVMEKIDGENLQEWLEKRGNRPINEIRAIQWLQELASILHEVHQQQLFHRDIKPSNIMLKADGQLVLIDFGIVREITKTYEQKQAAGQVTKIWSYGYAPLEQELGQAVPQSDFFALGRTFVYLLTGKHPQDIGKPYRDPNTDEEWNWRDEAPDISSQLADFINKLMAPSIKNRPANTQELLQELVDIEQSLYPQKPSKLTLTNTQLGISWQNVTLERTLGDPSSWHSKSVNSIAISPDGKTLISGSADQRIKVWDLKTGEAIHTFTDHTGSVTSVAISSDGETLVSGSQDGTVRAWSLKTREAIIARRAPSSHVISLAFQPNKPTLFFSEYADPNIRVWNLETQQITHTYPSYHTGFVTSLAISSNGQTLASGSCDKTIIVWTDHTLIGHSDIVWSVAISPDGQTLVSGSQDKEIKVWNLINGELLNTLTGHLGPVLCVAISPNGQIIASGSEDKTVKVWDLNSGQLIHTLTKHLDAVTCLAISPDGQTLVSGSRDYTIKMWRMS